MTLSLFAVSLAMCALMIATRLAELKRQKTFAPTEFINRWNTDVEAYLAKAKAFALKAKQEGVFFVTHYVPFYAWNQARHLTSGLRRHYDKIERTVRGRNMIRQTGEASEFIKHIARHKESLSATVQEERVE